MLKTKKYINSKFYIKNIMIAEFLQESNKSYKIRVVGTNDEYGDIFAVTITREIANKFSGAHLFPYVSGNCLIFESGTKIRERDIYVR